MAKADGTMTVVQAAITVLGGKGRFEGAKGDGTLTGARLAPLSSGADQYNDVVINLKK
jgi:hypothetical protein